MDLSGFSSYVEIFTVINLGYAGYDTFRTGIDARIFSFSSKINENIALNIDKNMAIDIVDNAENLKNGQVSPELKLTSTFLAKGSQISSEIDAFQTNLPKSMKPIFLLSGLVCLIFLIAIGVVSSNVLKNPNTIVVFMAFFIVITIPTIKTFYNVLTNPTAEHSDGRINNLMFFILVGCIATFFCCFCPNYPDWLYRNDRIIVFFTILIPIMPFVCYFILLTIIKKSFQKKQIENDLEYEKAIKKLALDKVGYGQKKKERD